METVSQHAASATRSGEFHSFFFLTLVVVGHLCLQEQRFLEHFNAIKDRVEHELLRVYENIPNPDHKRVVEDIKAMEQALEILTVEYPRLAAMLDELRYTFSLQGAMPMPHVLNLNIRVFDIMVDKLGLDLGLLGKISSLQGIKAHVIYQFCFPTEVEKVEAELRQAVDIHHPNNPPTLEIIRYAEDRMVNSYSDSQMSLRRQILTEQRFHENLNAVKDRVEHELLRVNENIPNRDLKRVTDEIEDMEQALQILTVEYPRQAAMLEQLKTALGLEAEDEDEDEDEVTDDKEASATSLSKEVVFAASVSETNGEEVSAASLSGREEEKKRRRRPWQSPYPTEKRRMR
ncbi:uncharacterized protein [Miscanthus floridulus]|uniref:uncharacterized protein n=1 Tax=Miscanthus floridulus TaxID=154761 RepID=UPI00345A2FB4